MPDKTRRRATWALLAGIIAFSLGCAWPGVHAYFSVDDVMNLRHLHGALERPYSASIADVLEPWKASYRPFGGLFYRTLFAVFGFHPLPFRVVCFTLLAANLVLAFLVLRRLSGSREAAVLGTLLLSYNAAEEEIYFNTGTIYELLCAAFFLGAVLAYARWRRPRSGFGWGALAGLVMLNLLALESKEMACMLPAVWLLYEVLYFGLPGVGGWLNRFGACALGSLLCGAFLLVRMLTPNAFSANPLYHPTLSLTYYLRSAAAYQGLWFSSPHAFGVIGLLAFWISLAAIAAWLRSRAALFGLAFWITTLVPVALLPARGGYVLYLPAVGLALYAGAVLALLRRKTAVPQFALVAIVAGVVAMERSALGASAAVPFERVQQDTRELIAQLESRHPKLSSGARVLFTEDPFGPNPWFLQDALELRYRDPGIMVDGARFHPHARGYDYVFAYADGRLTELGSRAAPCPAPLSAQGVVDDSAATLCWTGEWVTQQFPEAVDGTITHTDRKDATVELAFEGSALTYFYTRAFNRGFAVMTIDGVQRATIDLYSSVVEWRSSTVFGALGPGRHKAILRVLGRHSSHATGSTVDVDAFEIGR